MTVQAEQIKQLVDELSTEIAEVEPQPSQWSGWVVRLLEQLEIKITSEEIDDTLEHYEDMLTIVQQAIQERLQRHRW